MKGINSNVLLIASFVDSSSVFIFGNSLRYLLIKNRTVLVLILKILFIIINSPWLRNWLLKMKSDSADSGCF